MLPITSATAVQNPSARDVDRAAMVTVIDARMLSRPTERSRVFEAKSRALVVQR